MSELHVETSGSGTPAVFVHGSMGWGLDTFADQCALARRGYRVRLVDRRGFGASPDVDRVDFERDAADVAELLDERSHLVGQSYGGLVVALAACLRPEAVLSLTLIEPAIFALVTDDEGVQAYLSRLSAAFAAADSLTPEQFWVRFVEAGGATGIEVPAFTAEDRRAVVSTMRERPFWEARLDLQSLAAAPFPKLVCTGGRAAAPAPVKALGGRAWMIAASSVARAIGAELTCFEDSAHNPQFEDPERFNAALLKFWDRADARGELAR